MRFSETLKKYWEPIILFFVVISAWEGLEDLLNFPTFIIPKPSQIVGSLLSPRFEWPTQIYVTTYETVVGFILATALALAIALGMSRFDRLNRLLYPYVVILQVIPKVALAPIFIILLGFGEAPKVLMTLLIAFFPVLINTLAGLSSVPSEIIDVVRGLGASYSQTLRMVKLPSSLPFIFAGLRISITSAAIGAIVAEFAGANNGIGFILIVSGTYGETAPAFAALVLAALLGIILYAVIVLIEKWAMPWTSLAVEREKGGGL